MELVLKYSEVIRRMNTYQAKRKAFLFIIDFSKTKGICILSDKIPTEFIKFSMNSMDSELELAKKIEFSIKPSPYLKYLKKFNKILKEISLGNSYLCNLTQPTEIQTNLSLEEIYTYSKAKHKLYLKDCFVVFSPETFLTIDQNIIHTFPIKGTIPVKQDPTGEILLKSAKENAEHSTIVDLMRNDLSMVASEVQVKQFKKIQKIQTNSGSIWQMFSEISGHLKPEFHSKLGNLFDRVLPAGSISGAPKAKTLEIINQTEDYERGFYTGVFGFYDGSSLTSSVIIRYIEKTEKGLIYKSGGGITSHSQAEQEYMELIQKIYVPIF